MRGRGLLLGAAAVLLVACLLAYWSARTGSARTTTPSHPGDAKTPDQPPAPAAVQAPAGRKLLVTVRDAGSGAPLPGATLRVHPWSGERFEVVTDARGEAEMGPVWGEVAATHRGHSPECVRVGPSTPQLIFLLRPGISVRGRVVRTGTGEGIGGASVVVTDVDASDTIAELVTDHEGRFEVPGVPPEAPLLLVAQRAGMAPAGRVERRAEPGREIILELAGGAVVEGRIVRPDATLAAGAKVKVQPRGGEPLLLEDLPCSVPDYVVETRADAGGKFRVEGLRVPAAYEIRAEDDRLSTGRADDVELRDAGKTAWREIRLVARTMVRVRVEFPPGEPWPHPGVQLRHEGDDIAAKGIDEDGYTWEVKTLGPHEVIVCDSAWPTTRVPIDVREGLNEVVVRMTREGHRVVSGRLTTEAGIPLSGGEIGVTFRSPGGTLRGYPGADGRFHICDVADAAGTLEVNDETGLYSPWSRSGVVPGETLEIVLRAAAGFEGRIDPVPATRRIVVHRLNRHHLFTQDNEVGDWLVTTDEQGAFRIPWAPGRPVSLAFDPPDAAPILLDEPALAEGEIRDLGVLLPGPGRSAEGVVVDDTGSPVADCRLSLEMRFGRGRDTWVVLSGADLEDRRACTTADGRFRFSRLPEAPLRLEASADGFVARALDLPAVNDLQGLRIPLMRAGWVQGVLADAGGRPIAGETVECACDGRDEPFWGRTDSLGRFRIAVAPGKYRLKNGDHEGPAVDVRAREETQAEFRLNE